ncbi:MAG: hypothetical protein UT24_C0036G0007 [Candidatus Woesebacteria bacterium GW2011_GWB1_39_12]|uniref:Uncharacterized protein n=1 Tax=Candidatus Woesebacteria bacterium GW2011_GWB1_39_12 TaxID=1618574 RepID=A0A0G0PL08_9BACT|nr:MAG: hypothetical protein UT24_C0036G0007 [Candidatus Woesebacteria bacterium GW2011_GWB1_39_12]
MPLSGSYFYPVAQVPVSSYKTVVIRGIGSPPDTAAGAGHLYILSSSNDLYYKDADGNEIVLGSGGGSGENVFDNVYVSSSLLVKGDSVLSGNVVVGGQIYDLNSNLILSSAVGSIIAASGSIDFTNTDKNYHIRAVNSHLILSSSVGSVIAVSGAFHFKGITAGTQMFSAEANLASGYPTLIFNNSTTAPNILPHRTNTGTGIGSSIASQIDFWLGAAGAGQKTMFISGSGELVLSGNLPGQVKITAKESHLILSSSVGSIIALSASQDFANSDTAYHIRAVNSHLILSSSAGSVIVISGSQLKLPADGATLQMGPNGQWLTSGGSTTITSAGNGALTLFENSAGGGGIQSKANYHRISNRAGTVNYLFVSGTNGIAGVLLSGGLNFSQEGLAYNVVNDKGHLILSSSVGSVVALSASKDYVNADKPYHIRAVNSDLILSSSAGSKVRVSGTISIGETNGPSDTLSISHNGTSAFINADSGAMFLRSAGVFIDQVGTGTGLLNVTKAVYHSAGALVLSSSSTSVVALSASQDFVNSDKDYHIRAVNSHLILSSSTGSVVKVSGNLDIGGSLSKYNGIATAGVGLSPIVAYGTVSTSTSGIVIVTYTPTADGIFEIGSTHEVTDYTSGNVSVLWEHTSVGGVATSRYAWGADLDGGAESNHLTADNTLRDMNTLTISAKANTNISGSTFISATATGSFYAWIRQIA